MSDTKIRELDTTDLEARIKTMYALVADAPDQGFHFETGRALAEHLGYPAEALALVPPDAVTSFAGVGYFLDLADLKPGEAVLDLGSGSGTDSFLAAHAVGPSGSVTGIDMTPAQLAKANRLAAEAGIEGVKFVEGHIEESVVSDGSVDCVISNGVINLSPDKAAVFRAAAAALRPAGRLAIADIVTATTLPESVTCDASLWAACIGGATQRDQYLTMLENAGFTVETVRENDYRFVSDRALGATSRYGVTSVSVLARRT